MSYKYFAANNNLIAQIAIYRRYQWASIIWDPSLYLLVEIIQLYLNSERMAKFPDVMHVI